MRCFSCDNELSDYEATLKSPSTGEYLDMCVSCIRKAEIPAFSVSTLCKAQEYEEEIEYGFGDVV